MRIRLFMMAVVLLGVVQGLGRAAGGAMIPAFRVDNARDLAEDGPLSELILVGDEPRLPANTQLFVEVIRTQANVYASGRDSAARVTSLRFLATEPGYRQVIDLRPQPGAAAPAPGQYKIRMSYFSRQTPATLAVLGADYESAVAERDLWLGDAAAALDDAQQECDALFKAADTLRDINASLMATYATFKNKYKPDAADADGGEAPQNADEPGPGKRRTKNIAQFQEYMKVTEDMRARCAALAADAAAGAGSAVLGEAHLLLTRAADRVSAEFSEINGLIRTDKPLPEPAEVDGRFWILNYRQETARAALLTVLAALQAAEQSTLAGEPSAAAAKLAAACGKRVDEIARRFPAESLAALLAETQALATANEEEQWLRDNQIQFLQSLYPEQAESLFARIRNLAQSLPLLNPTDTDKSAFDTFETQCRALISQLQISNR